MYQSGFFRRISLAEGAVILLLITLGAACLTMLGQIRTSNEHVIARTVESARSTSRLAAAATAQYLESVSAFVQDDRAVFVSDRETATNGLHLPITFTRSLAAAFTQSSPGATFSIYSDFPFDGRDDHQLDAFAREALDAFANRADGEHWKAEPAPGGAMRVRYAVPLVMRPGCVECHNQGPWSQRRTDWQVGDVRGVREVAIEIPASELTANPQVRNMFALLAISALTTLLVVFPVVRNEVLRRTHFHQLSQDLSARAQEHERDALTDPLSSLSNRRGFDQIMRHCQEKHCAATPKKAGFILIDIDNFKAINDKHGHAAGDEVIAAIGLALRDNIRPDDCAARIGGEEFAIMVPEATVSDMADLAERVRLQIAQLRFVSAHGPFSVTISAGATELRPDEDPQDCFRRADMLLYHAKSNGRDRVASSVRAPSRPNQISALS